MLKLLRKPGQTIEIEGDIVIHVQRFRGGGVSIGVEAPKSTRIRRGELVAKSAEPPTNPEKAA